MTQALQSERERDALKARLQAALLEEVALVERAQALELRAAELEQEVAEARSGGSAEAAALEGRVRELGARVGELEGLLEEGGRARAALEEERAGLLGRIGGLEREVVTARAGH